MRTLFLAALLTLAPVRADSPTAPTLTPAEKARFDQAADYSTKYAGHAVLIMRAGHVVYERYDGWTADRSHPLASGTKSFTGVAAMCAVQDGLFTLDEKVADTIVEWKSDPLKSQITVRHLLTLSSGLLPDSKATRNGAPAPGGDQKGLEGALARLGADDWFADAVSAPMTGKPGAQFAYGGNHFYAFGEFLERKLKADGSPHKTAWDYYAAKIFQPIGMTIGRIGRDKAGHPNLPGGAQLTAREWARFGQLVLQNGSWKQADGTMKELIKPELLARCFEPSAKNPAYGLTWWLRNTGEKSDAKTVKDPAVADGPVPTPPADDKQTPRQRIRERALQSQGGQNARQAAQNEAILAPDGKPVTVRMAAGLGKQRLYVLPQYDLVVVRFADIGATRAGQGFDDRLFLAPILGFDKDGKKIESK